MAANLLNFPPGYCFPQGNAHIFYFWNETLLRKLSALRSHVKVKKAIVFCIDFQLGNSRVRLRLTNFAKQFKLLFFQHYSSRCIDTKLLCDFMLQSK